MKSNFQKKVLFFSSALTWKCYRALCFHSTRTGPNWLGFVPAIWHNSHCTNYSCAFCMQVLNLLHFSWTFSKCSRYVFFLSVFLSFLISSAICFFSASAIKFNLMHLFAFTYITLPWNVFQLRVYNRDH